MKHKQRYARLSESTASVHRPSEGAFMITYNNSVLKVGSSWLKTSLNPLGLPPYTMRFLFDAPFYDPTDYSYVKGTWHRVSTTPNIWDFTYFSTNWGRRTVA